MLNQLKDLLSLFYPKLCVGCSEALMTDENFLCPQCFLNLPKTNYHLSTDNLAFDRFLGKAPIQKATSYLYYNKNGLGQKVVAEIKYRSNTGLGRWIGSYLAKDLLASGFFAGIDFLVPVPLHKKKLRKRGFNQAEILTEGIAAVTGIPMEAYNLYRKKANETQTKKGLYERWQNTQGLFQLKDNQLFKNKHLLLVDDVLTTGSTLEACAHAVLSCKNTRISILTLAIA